MKKTMSVLVAAGSLFAIAACSSNPKQSWTPNYGTAPITYEDVNSFAPKAPEPKGEQRQPSAQIIVESDPVNLDIRSGDESYRQIVRVNKFFQVDLPCQKEEQVPVYTIRETECQQAVCASGGGKSPKWNAYFSGAGDKVDALQQAIQGLDKKSAQALHDNKVFMQAGRGKPKSWNQFVAVLSDAVSKRIISMSEYRQVTTGNLGLVNAENLGYGSSCSYQVGRCQSVVETFETRMVQSTCTQKIPQGSIDYTLVFRAIGGKFVPGFESDRIIATAGEGTIQFEMNAPYNQYKITQSYDAGARTFEVTAQATARNLVAPRRDYVTDGVMEKTTDGKYRFAARVNKEFLARLNAVEPGAKVVVDYQTMGCKTSWITGYCKAFDSYFTIPNVNASSVLVFDATAGDTQAVEVKGPVSGQANWIAYKYRVSNSSLFSPAPFREENSNTLYK